MNRLDNRAPDVMSPEIVTAVRVRNLRIEVPRNGRRSDGVSDVTFDLAPGDKLAIVGESGSGKSLTARAVAGILPAGTGLAGGSVCFSPDGERRGIVLQEALSALNPTRKVGDIIADGAQQHGYPSRRAARREAVRLMAEVGIPEPDRRFHAYPHELSGGLRQRVMIATALSTDPAVLICDEPTTALDVRVQKQILDLIERLVSERGMALLFVSHDLAVVAQLCTRIVVMYAGQVVESGRTGQVIDAPAHPYTRALLDAGLSAAERTEVLRPIPGTVPDVIDSVAGCRFAERCAFATDDCRVAAYQLNSQAPSRATACIRADELEAVLR
jgi:oligopeptide/dipeptide ABC transporter ATP-binding protein